MMRESRSPVAGPPQLAPRAMILDGGGRTLLLQRSAGSRHWPGEWELPGGKPEPGEDWMAALEREVFEETGLRVRATGLVGAAEHDLVIGARGGEPETIRRLIVLVLRCALEGGADGGAGDEVVVSAMKIYQLAAQGQNGQLAGQCLAIAHAALRHMRERGMPMRDGFAAMLEKLDQAAAGGASAEASAPEGPRDEA